MLPTVDGEINAGINIIKRYFYIFKVHGVPVKAAFSNYVSYGETAQQLPGPVNLQAK